ncbi:MAG: hypothetical protein F6K40_29645 [Okeania sp. SIO3I5]|uniref:hypothetical protein n=1 Tax=Okeania sp. SIO3I5 TaxID=2607805 RepID=UPI0013B68B5E|nr:hypothetical protein [Okeania sp. SIO3I5]NEQ40182.1 hypothetical protein [Okeania sp. SIO3I5]
MFNLARYIGCGNLLNNEKKLMVIQMRKNRYFITLLITISLVFLLETFFNNTPKNVNAQEYDNFPSSFVGVWEGSGVQNTGSEWSIFLALIPGSIDSIVGTIAYPSLICGGELTLQKLTEEKIELFENITYGKSSCVNRGYVTLEFVSRRKLNYYYKNQTGDENYAATGTVRKVSSN